MRDVLRFYATLGPLGRTLVLFPFGLVVGSFTSVVRHRIPLGQSIIFPRSTCPGCHHALGALDLVPLMSYAALRGRCRYCRTQIPSLYPLLEVASGLFATLGGILVGWSGGVAALLVWISANVAYALYKVRAGQGS